MNELAVRELKSFKSGRTTGINNPSNRVEPRKEIFVPKN